MIKMTPDDFITLGEQYGFKPYWESDSWYLLYDKIHYIASMEEDENKNIIAFNVVTEWEWDPDWNNVSCKETDRFDDDEQFKAALEDSMLAYKQARQDYELKNIKKDFR